MSKFAWVFMLLLVPTGSAFAEIYKCAGKHGLNVYQNFPCDLDRLGSVPVDPKKAKAPEARADASKPPAVTPTASAAPKPNAAASSSPAPAAMVAQASEPRVGMTADEVRALWGEPEEIIQDEPASGRIEIWRYADGRSVNINNKHRVSEVQR